MNLKLTQITIDPLRYGRFSLRYDVFTKQCVGIRDHFLNNTYSEQEFINEIGDYISLDEFKDAAMEMNVSLNDVPVYNAEGDITERTGKDYTENLSGKWIVLEEGEYE